MLHAMLHVQDMEKSLDFYRGLGMELLSCNRRSNGMATAFVGFGKLRDMEHFALELSKPKDPAPPVDMGSFKGLLLSGADRQLSDPDGYAIRFQESEARQVLAVQLLTTDLESSLEFYQRLGMELHPEGLRYAQGAATHLCLEESSSVHLGTAFDHLVIATEDVEKAFKELKEQQLRVILEPTVMFGLKITGVTDPAGHKVYLVDESDFQKQS